MSPRPPDPELVRVRRSAILEAAAGRFAGAGYEATTIAQIAGDAGVSPATVFHYFGDKSAVFRGIFAADRPAAEELLARQLTAADPLAALLAVVTELVAPASDPVAPGLVVELIRRVGHDPELATVVAATDRLVLDGLSELIERATANGQIAPGVPARRAAVWLQTLVDGVYLHAEEYADPAAELRQLVPRMLVTGAPR